MENPFGFEPSEDMPPLAVITKDQLVEANKWAIKVGYNRALEVAPLNKFLKGYDEDVRFPILMSILHEHKGGQQCEPHMRCEVVLGPTGPKVLIDLDMDLFTRLERVVYDEEE